MQPVGLSWGGWGWGKGGKDGITPTTSFVDSPWSSGLISPRSAFHASGWSQRWARAGKPFSQCIPVLAAEMDSVIVFVAVSSAFQFAGVIHWISLVILSVFFSEVGARWALRPPLVCP